MKILDFTPRYNFPEYQKKYKWYEFSIVYYTRTILDSIPKIFIDCYLFDLCLYLPYKHTTHKKLTIEEKTNNKRYIILSDILLNKKIKIKPQKITNGLILKYGVEIVKIYKQKLIWIRHGEETKSIKLNYFIF